jgi:hypothetical protein
LSSEPQPKPILRRLSQWFVKGFKPGDLVTALSVFIAGVGVWIAFSQFKDALAQETRATKESQLQNEQIQQQSEDNEPFLIPATPPAERGTIKTAYLNFGHITKRADRLYVAPPHPRSGIFKARLVIPLQNGGSGIALVYEHPAFVSSCARANELPKRLANPAGTYVVRTGEADQFGFFQPSTPGGTLPSGGWYSFDYEQWGRSRLSHGRASHRRATPYTPYRNESSANVVVWYSDGARSTLRWMCAQYVFAGVGRGGLEYAVVGQTFGESGKPSS